MKHTPSLSLYKQYLFKLLISPVTYVTSVVVILFCSLQFFLGQQFFTEAGSTDLHHFFSAIPYICIIAVPSMAVSLNARREEQSYPVNVLIIPFVKFCALYTIFFITMCCTIFVPIAVSFFGDVEVSQCICGYIGILFYFFAATSVSVFFITLIKVPSLSFVITALVLAIVNSAHLLPLYINLPAWFATLCRSLSFAWHFDAAGKGIIDTRDILFYIIVSTSFILLSGMVIECNRGERLSLSSKRNRSFTGLVILTSIAAGLLFVDNTRIYKRFDTTRQKKFTVTEYSRTLLSEAEEPLSFTYYRSPSLIQLYPQVRDVRDFLDSYASSNSRCTVSIIDTSKEEVASRLEKYGVQAQQIQTAGRDKTSYETVYSAIIISYLNKTEVIPFVLDTTTLEYDLSSRIASLVRGTKREVQVVVGNGLSLNEAYSYVVPWLESQGFSVYQKILLSQATESNKDKVFSISTDMPLLVIGTSQFTSEDCERLEEAIISGEQVFIATTPYSVNIAGDWSVTQSNDKVCKLLSSMGIAFKNTLTADISNFRITFYSDTNSDGTAAANSRTEYVNYPLWPVLRPQQYALNGMTLFWPCAMTYENSNTELEKNQNYIPILSTSTASWQVSKTKDTFETNPFVVSKTSSQQDEKGPFIVACKLTGKIDGYYTTGSGISKGLIVFGDQYAFSTDMLNYSSGTNGDYRSLDFLADSLLDLQGQGAILPLKNRNYATTSLYKISLADLHDYRLQTCLLTCGIPVVLLLVLLIVVIAKRKRMNKLPAYGAKEK